MLGQAWFSLELVNGEIIYSVLVFMRTRIFLISLLSWHCFKDCNSSGHQLLCFPSHFLLVSLITLSGKQLSGFS